MAKHWRYEDDVCLVEFFPIVGDFVGQHDLGRPKGAATRRVAHLKETGAWDALCRQKVAGNKANIQVLVAELDYARALGFDVGSAKSSEEEATCPADLYAGDYPWRREDPFAAEEMDVWSSDELGDLIQEVVAEHNDVDGVSWRHVACEIAKALEIMLLDVRPSTGLPADLEPHGGKRES